MGNAMIISFSPAKCFKQNPNSSGPKLIFFDGTTRILGGKRKRIAGEFMFEFPDSMVCHADSFFIGRPIPALGINSELIRGQTYFVLPIDRFSCGDVLSVSSLAAFSAPTSPNNNQINVHKPASPINFKSVLFEYLKGSDGKISIKVSPEFIESLIMRDKETAKTSSVSNSGGFICSTPELQKHYEQLVGFKEQLWSPKLETISEHKNRFSPCRFIGL